MTLIADQNAQKEPERVPVYEKVREAAVFISELNSSMESVAVGSDRTVAYE